MVLAVVDNRESKNLGGRGFARKSRAILKHIADDWFIWLGIVWLLDHLLVVGPSFGYLTAAMVCMWCGFSSIVETFTRLCRSQSASLAHQTLAISDCMPAVAIGMFMLLRYLEFESGLYWIAATLLPVCVLKVLGVMLPGGFNLLAAEMSQIESRTRRGASLWVTCNRCDCCELTGMIFQKCACKQVHYCGAECQKADWPLHKVECSARCRRKRE